MTDKEIREIKKEAYKQGWNECEDEMLFGTAKLQSPIYSERHVKVAKLEATIETLEQMQMSANLYSDSSSFSQVITIWLPHRLEEAKKQLEELV